jgi:magnesium-transporting ATPase (P-type)
LNIIMDFALPQVFDARSGTVQPMTPSAVAALEKKISDMADGALRTLVLAHRDFAPEALPANWAECPPELDMDMVCDAIVGIQDPLRPGEPLYPHTHTLFPRLLFPPPR